MPPSWLLPEHFSDALPSEARRIEELRRGLLDLYRGYGYELIAPPLIEYLDSLLTGSGSQLAMRTFQTVDQLSGKTLGVRADITPQAARVDAHLLNRAGVTRLCYAGAVAHTRPASALATREPFQVGAELFGHGGLEAELELLQLLIESLHLAGLTEIRIDLAHAAIVPALMTMAAEGGWPHGSAVDMDAVYGLLVQKDHSGLQELLTDCPSPAREGLLSLVRLYGPVSALDCSVIDQAAASLPSNPLIDAALQSLRALVGATVWGRLSGVRLAIDLADLQGYHYYSGVSFTAFALPAADASFHGQALARGGRYDGIGRAFGRDRPAVGFSLELRQIAALGMKSLPPARPAVSAPWVDDPALSEAIAMLRNAGEVVIQALPGHDQEQDEFNCDRELILQTGRWTIRPINH